MKKFTLLVLIGLFSSLSFAEVPKNGFQKPVRNMGLKAGEVITTVDARPVSVLPKYTRNEDGSIQSDGWKDDDSETNEYEVIERQ